MTGTDVTIAADGSVKIAMDLYYEEMGRLYCMEKDRIMDSAREHNFFSHKHLVLCYSEDNNCINVNFSTPPQHSQALRNVHSPRNDTGYDIERPRQWQVVLTGKQPGVFERLNDDCIDDNIHDYYATFEDAKAAFSRAVRDGCVTRIQKIVTRERLLLDDDYIGSTTDEEVLACTTQWHVVTVGREPGIFSSESRFEIESTRSNICDIEGGTISIYSTAELALRGFAEAIRDGMVERVSVVNIREVMRNDDFPDLLEP